ncbi:MAG: hypothetical protein ABIP42_10665 [Planctomycetota bacterium]
MAGGVGNLTVGLGLDAAEYTRGLSKAEAQASASAQRIKESFLGNLGAGLTRDLIRGLAQVPAAFVGMVRGAIDAADHLNDLSKKTGIAVETLGGIGFAAKQAGGDLESVAAAAGKLNKSVAEAAAGNAQAGEAFKLLGINVKDAAGQTRSADAVMADVATRFASFKDGPEKAALALRIFGKAGADIIPLLNEGGAALLGNIAYFQRFSGVSAQTAKDADAFNDTLTKLNLLQQAFGQNVASSLLGPLQAVALRFLEAKEKGDGFKTAADGIASAFIGLASAVSFVVESLGALAARFDGLVQKAQALGSVLPAATGNALFDVANAANSIVGSDLGQQLDQINKIVEDRVATAQKNHDRFVSALNFDRDNQGVDFGREGRSRAKALAQAPRLKPTGGGGPKDDPTQKLLDNELKRLEAQIDAEKQLFQTRNRFIEVFNSQNLLSIADYYNAREVAQRRAVGTELDLIDNEILALQAHQSKRSTTAVKREADEGKIIDLRKRRAKIEIDADADAIERDIRRREALKELAKAFEGVNAQVFDLKENFAAAAAIRFDQQFGELQKTFSNNGNQAGVDAIAQIRAATIAQAAFQKASLDSSRTIEDLSRLEERLGLAQQTGALTSLEGLAKVGEARRAQIPIIEAQVAAQEALAAVEKAKGTLGFEKLIRDAEGARFALDKLKASSDPLGESLNKTFGGDFNTALDDFVTGTKNATAAFKSFAKSVLNDILKMGSKSITESIFGGSGGVGGFISQLFGTGSAQGAASGGLVGIVKNLFGGGATAKPAAALAADDGTTAGIKATIESLSGLSSGAKGAADSLASHTTAVSDSVSAFDGLGSTLSGFGDTVGSVSKDFASSIADLFAGSGGSGGGDGSWASFAETFAGFFATGGRISAGKWGVVGENGPELAFGGTTGKTVVPASGGGTTQNFNVNVSGQPGMSRDSALQQGAAIGQGIQKALARNT